MVESSAARSRPDAIHVVILSRGLLFRAEDLRDHRPKTSQFTAITMRVS
jgi:hypothetical protein